MIIIRRKNDIFLPINLRIKFFINFNFHKFNKNFLMRIIVILSILFSFSAQSSNDTIIDANFSRAEVFSGKIIPSKVIKNQRLIKIFYYGFDNKIHQGQLVCNYLFADQLKSIFDKLLKDKFPIYSVIPIHKFNWSDS